jgi:hypothetical protein
MIRVRVVLGLAAIACALGVLASPALAANAKKQKEPAVFGKFTANLPGTPGGITPATPATARGHGELTEISLAGGALTITECGKELKSTGKVEQESSETFFQNIVFSHCFAQVKLEKSGFVGRQKVNSFTLGLEFHSNKSAVLGQGEESEVKVVTPSSISVKIGKFPCTVIIPSQTVPSKAARKPEAEYEAATYETEKEPANIKKFPSGFQEKLDIEMEFNKVKSYLVPNPPGCEDQGGAPIDEEEGSPYKGDAEYGKGHMELELEEITIKHGNLGFEPKKEV